MKKLFASLALAAAVAPVWAATQTVTLAVPGMTCAACPITVKKALSKVEGVSKVDVGFEKGSVAKIVKLEHAWRRLDGRNDDGFQVAPFPG